MEIDWNHIQNPILDREPNLSLRDPALYYFNDTFYLFHTAVEHQRFQYTFYLDVSISKNLYEWSKPKRVIDSDLGYSSPGNVFQVGNTFYLSIQTYPVPKFKQYASEESRLWIIESKNMTDWSEPRLIKEQGACVNWSKSHRQIDPFIIENEHQFYCFYKTSGRLGVLISKNLNSWEEGSIDVPVLSKEDIPDHATIENICIVKEDPHKPEFTMFFSPCYAKRGVGVARSSDLLHWTFIDYLKFPMFEWAGSKPTAPSVIDMRDICGKWIMAFHADRKHPHGGALGLAWSKDLINWDVPKNEIPTILLIFD
jgi:hypothetical protein